MAQQLDLNLSPAPGVSEQKTVRRTPEQTWLDWAASEWSRYHRRQMTVRWSRDVALIKPLLRLHGDQELRARWRAHIRSLDEYIARKGWNVPSFSESIDRYAGEQDCAEAVRAHSLYKRELDRIRARVRACE